MSDLPPGFELDHTEQALPPGFVLDSADNSGPSLVGGAKSLGLGLLKGTIGTGADLVSAVDHLMSGDKATTPNVFGSESIGKLYQPQGAGEQALDFAGQFLPAIVGGGEGIASKLATRVAAPALATEAASKLTEGTAAQPYAELGAALLGGAGATAAANKFRAMAAARGAANAVPSAEQLFKSADGGFNAARDMNVVVKPEFTTNAAADMRDAIKNYDPNVVKDVQAAADRLEGLGRPPPSPVSPAQRLQSEMNWEPTPSAPQPTPVAMNDLEHIRQQLTSLKTSTDGSIRSAAKDAIASMQKSQMGITPADTLSGDAGAYTNLIKNAVGDWGAMRRSNAVMGKVDLANLNAGTAGVGANYDNAQRQAIKQLARPINNTNMPVWKKLGFNNEEGAAINKAATGTMVGNTARYVGKAAPTGIVSGALSGDIGLHLGGTPAAIALPAVGYIAKKIGDLSTKKAVAALDSLVRSRSPLAAKVAVQIPHVTKYLPPVSSRLLTAMIAADPLLSQQLQPAQ